MPEKNLVGFAELYLIRNKQSVLTNNADIDMYNQLRIIDSSLGTKDSENLLGCLMNTQRLDLIEV